MPGIRRKIGREAGVDCKTVARYTATAAKLGVQRGRELTHEEVHQVAQGVQALTLIAPSEEWNEVTQHRDRIERWLAGDEQTRPLRLPKVHTLLCRDHGLQASYDTLCATCTSSSPGETSPRRCASTIRLRARRRRSTSAG